MAIKRMTKDDHPQSFGRAQRAVAESLGLGLWPQLDVPGGAGTILAALGWSAERIAQVLGEVEEAAA